VSARPLGTPMREVTFAGTAGGVGTTTIAALTFSELGGDRSGAPALLDHSAGDLGRRLAEGDETIMINSRIALHDLGAHAFDAGLDRLADRSAILVAVTAATPAGFALAWELVEMINERRGLAGLRRTLLVCVGVFGRHRTRTRAEELRRRVGWRSVVVFGQDRSLAAGGRVPLARLTSKTQQASTELAEVIRSRLA
jgi:hypothetical protein